MRSFIIMSFNTLIHLRFQLKSIIHEPQYYSSLSRSKTVGLTLLF